MTTRELLYIKTIADERSMTRAAQAFLASFKEHLSLDAP